MSDIRIAGRIVRDAQVFENSDGSRKVLFKVARQRNYKGKDGKRGADFPEFEIFVARDKTDGRVERLVKGQYVVIDADFMTPAPYEKDGATVYPNTVNRVTNITLVGYPSKSEQAQIAEAAAANGAAAAAVPAENEAAPEMIQEELPFAD